jgi:hypothetical protein
LDVLCRYSKSLQLACAARRDCSDSALAALGHLASSDSSVECGDWLDAMLSKPRCALGECLWMRQAVGDLIELHAWQREQAVLDGKVQFARYVYAGAFERIEALDDAAMQRVLYRQHASLCFAHLDCRYDVGEGGAADNVGIRVQQLGGLMAVRSLDALVRSAHPLNLAGWHVFACQLQLSSWGG